MPKIDTRHGEFETHADKKTALYLGSLIALPINDDDFSDETLGRAKDVTSFYLRAAAEAKRIWTKSLRDIARRKPRIPQPGRPTDWSDADDSIKDALQGGCVRVAQFLSYWVRCARQDIGELGVRRGRWLSIIEPTRGDRLRQTEMDGHIARAHGNADSHSSLVLEFDANGFCRLAAKATPKLIWSWRIPAVGPFLQAVENEPDCRLRIVPIDKTAAYVYTSRRLREGEGGDEALTVASPGLVTHQLPTMGRARPSGDGESQLVCFEDAGSLTLADRKTIRQERTGIDFITMPWWGVADGVPRWREWTRLSSQPNGKPTALAAASSGSGLIDLFAIIGGKVRHRAWLGFWNDWDKPPVPDHGADMLNNNLAAIASDGNRLDVFANSHAKIYQATRIAGQWSWHSFAAPPHR